MNPSERWPDLVRAEFEGTVGLLHRIAQIGGKQTLFAPHEPNWSNITLRLTARGYATPTLYADGVACEIRYEILDDRVDLVTSAGRASLPLGPGSVADFYTAFVAAASPLGIPLLRTTIETEIPGAPHLEDDREFRPYDARAARKVWQAFSSASKALVAWQSTFAGQRPPVGLMWGGFDLAALRYRGVPKAPASERPVFLRNGMTQEEIAVGFSLGDASTPPGFYAYTAPALEPLTTANLGPGAGWVPEAGVAALPWSTVRASADPEAAVVAFADAVYAVAVGAGWPPDTRERCDGWYASTVPLAE